MLTFIDYLDWNNVYLCDGVFYLNIPFILVTY